MPKVSIITASYNYENYIKETIESVIAQSYTDWEMIIVDDGSKDNSINVIKSYCNKDSRIKLYTHKNHVNKGLSETLKLGIKHANSEWIVFLESDDTITPDYLQTKLDISKKYPYVDIIYNNVNMFGYDDIIRKYKRGYFRRIKPYLNNIKFPSLMYEEFKRSTKDNLIPTFSVMMLKKYVLEGIKFNSPVEPYVDWYIWLQIVSKRKYYFFYTEKPLTNWRMHKNSLISAKIKEINLIRFEFDKSILLHKYTNVFTQIKRFLRLIRRQIIRLHFRDGETYILKRKYKTPFLRSLFSKSYSNKHITYKIMGFKISYKNKAKTVYDIKEMNLQLKEMILSPEFKYISFDIFDTLLVRPCVFPHDIFALIAEKVDKKYGIDFFSMRIHAEFGIENATINDIYDAMQANYDITDELKNILMQEEINAEFSLLYPRDDFKKFYELAVESGKKIIAVSDMYLPSSVLEQILKKNGYEKISKVFVSNEHSARKDNGLLFDIVINELNTTDILHIGDNKHSDYIVPTQKTLGAFHYPKITDILISNYPLLERTLKKVYTSDVALINRNVFIGYILNYYWFNRSNFNSNLFNTLEDFTNLFLAPYLCYITMFLQNNVIIQNLYDKIYFVARDGYLPNKIYNILNNGKYIKSEYIYGSRVAYWTGTYTSFIDLLKQQYSSFQYDYTFEDFLNAYICDQNLLINLKAKYKNEELQLTIQDNLLKCISLINEYEEIYTSYYNHQNNLAKEYYNQVFKNTKDRIAVFDVGYSGSISLGISKLTPKIIDKIYIRETEKNIFRDNRNGTYTFIIKNGIESNKFRSLDLILEESFSPLEGTCIGFKSNGTTIVPILENMQISSLMKYAQLELHENSEAFAKKLVKYFGEYFKYLNITDINPLIECTDINFKLNPVEKNIFKDIIFNDTATMHKQCSLNQKFIDNI